MAQVLLWYYPTESSKLDSLSYRARMRSGPVPGFKLPIKASIRISAEYITTLYSVYFLFLV